MLMLRWRNSLIPVRLVAMQKFYRKYYRSWISASVSIWLQYVLSLISILSFSTCIPSTECFIPLLWAYINSKKTKPFRACFKVLKCWTAVHTVSLFWPWNLSNYFNSYVHRAHIHHCHTLNGLQSSANINCANQITYATWRIWISILYMCVLDVRARYGSSSKINRKCLHFLI